MRSQRFSFDTSRSGVRFLLWPIAALTLLGCGEDTPTPPEPVEATPVAPVAPPPAALDVDDPSACAPCHGAIVEEWQTSMHAHAHHDTDVVYAAMRRVRMAREGDALGERCAQCHSPRDPEHLESPLARTGVSCATCHNLEGVETSEGVRGASALRRAPHGGLRGPHDIEHAASAPHGTGPAAPWLADGQTVCLACHGNLQNAQGVATCTTGAEYAAGDGEQPCTACHMPTVERPNGVASQRQNHRSHAFVGPHTLWGSENAEFMASSVSVSLSLEGTSLSASITNRTAHALPTGFPGRMILAHVIGLDSDGETVWQNFADTPMQEDPDAVFNKVYVDAEDEPTMPPYGTRLARDSRLEPEETRELRWVVPSDVVRAELTLAYRLLPPPAARAMEIMDEPEAQPRPFLTVTTASP